MVGYSSPHLQMGIIFENIFQTNLLIIPIQPISTMKNTYL
ncbi:unnamed protein product, partial [Vitis vinifera]